MLSLKETPESMAKSVRLLAAAKLVEMGKLSTGRAAELAGMSRVEFLDELGRLKISFSNLEIEDVIEDASRV